MRLASLALATGLLACTTNNTTVVEFDGGSGSTVTPSASGVFPAAGFLGRDVRVEITGDATAWSATTTVSFGTGVTVNSLSVASPTDLFADITISTQATVGLGDVVVTDGAATFTLSKAFQISAPGATAFLGVQAQGGITQFTITTADVANPFDATTGQDEFGDTIFPNILVQGPTGVTFQVESVTDFSIGGIALIDLDAATAAGDLTVMSGPAGGTVVVSDVGPMTVTARTATTLAAATAMTANVVNPLDSQLYTFTPTVTPTATAPVVEGVAAFTTNTGAAPALAVLPASGHFADLISFGPPGDVLNTGTAPGAQQFYIYWDNSGTSGYSYSIEGNDTALTHTATLGATNDTPATAAAMTIPGLAGSGDVSVPTDGTQWIKVTVPANGVGKFLHVITIGDPAVDGGTDASDIEVDVFATLADANAGTPLFTCITGGNVDCESPALTTTGNYFVEVQADPNALFSTTDYAAAVYLQPTQ